MKKGKVQAFLHSSPGSLACSLLVYSGLCTVFSLLASMILLTMADPSSSVRAFSLGAFLLTGAIGGLSLGRARREGGLLLIALGAVLFLLILLLIGLIGSGGALSLGVLMNDLCFLLVALFFGALGQKSGGKRRKKRR